MKNGTKNYSEKKGRQGSSDWAFNVYILYILESKEERVNWKSIPEYLLEVMWS